MEAKDLEGGCVFTKFGWLVAGGTHLLDGDLYFFKDLFLLPCYLLLSHPLLKPLSLIERLKPLINELAPHFALLHCLYLHFSVTYQWQPLLLILHVVPYCGRVCILQISPYVFMVKH